MMQTNDGIRFPMQVTFALVAIACLVFIPITSRGQAYLSLQNNLRMKRIRIEAGQEMGIRMKNEKYTYRIRVTAIKRDSIYFGEEGIATDSLEKIWLPASENSRHWIRMTGVAMVAGSIVNTMIWLLNDLAVNGFNPRSFAITMGINAALIPSGLLFMRLQWKGYRIGEPWELLYMDLQGNP